MNRSFRVDIEWSSDPKGRPEKLGGGSEWYNVKLSDYDMSMFETGKEALLNTFLEMQRLRWVERKVMVMRQYYSNYWNVKTVNVRITDICREVVGEQMYTYD